MARWRGRGWRIRYEPRRRGRARGRPLRRRRALRAAPRLARTLHGQAPRAAGRALRPGRARRGRRAALRGRDADSRRRAGGGGAPATARLSGGRGDEAAPLQRSSAAAARDARRPRDPQLPPPRRAVRAVSGSGFRAARSGARVRGRRAPARARGRMGSPGAARRAPPGRGRGEPPRGRRRTRSGSTARPGSNGASRRPPPPRSPRWIVAHSYHVGPAALAAGAPVWIDFHNLDSEIWRRTAAPRLLGARAGVRRGCRRPASRGSSGLSLPRAAGLSCVSRRDAEGLRALGAAVEPLVVPNGVDVSRYAMRREAAGRRRSSSSWGISPGPRTRMPSAGSATGSGRELRRLRPRRARRDPRTGSASGSRRAPGIPTSGSSARGGTRARTGPARRSRSCRCAPGGGTRLKILEAAASGVPVVSTPVGAEGLEFVPETRDPAARGARRRSRAAVAELLADPVAARARRPRRRARGSRRSTTGRRIGRGVRAGARAARGGAAHEDARGGSRADVARPLRLVLPAVSGARRCARAARRGALRRRARGTPAPPRSRSSCRPPTRRR